MSSVAVGRLRSIAKTVRQLPSFCRVRGAQDAIASHYFLIVDKGAAYIREAEALGAFQGDSIYGQIGEKLAHPSCHLDEPTPIAGWTLPLWKLTVWYAVVDTLAPELQRSRLLVGDANGNWSIRSDTSPEEAEIVARAIEAEADRIEADAGQEPAAARARPNDYRVSLGQVAGIVSKSKRSLERWAKNDSEFPAPEVQGGGGTTSFWKWSVIRPYLEKKTGLALPERFPSDPFRPDYGKVDADTEPRTTADI